MDAYGTRHALLVGPNSGYGLDNRCLLDTIARGDGRCKGVAVVANDATLRRAARRSRTRASSASRGTSRTTASTTTRDAGAARWTSSCALDMFVDIQVEHDQLVPLLPMLDALRRAHPGRPLRTADARGRASTSPAFARCSSSRATGRAFVKLSGVVKFSREPFPHADARPFVDALVDAFTLDRCLWASDWPYLRAPARVDYGVLLALVLDLLPDAAQRRKVLWETADALFRFTA